MAAAVKLPLRTEASERFYLPELDSLRFFAFFAVFFSHAYMLELAPPNFIPVPARISMIGLDLFFTLSAYLLTEILLREKASSDSVRVGTFYVRRALRIWPLYFTFLAVVFLLSRFSFGPTVAASTIAAFSFFVGDMACCFSHSISFTIGPLWSISIEEKFYILLPWIVRAATRRGLVLFAITIWVMSIMCRAIIFHGAYHKNPLILWYFPLTHLDSISCGILISAGGLIARAKAWARPRVLLIIGCTLWIAGGVLLPHSAYTTMFCALASYLMAAIGCGALVLATIGPGGWLLRDERLIYLGKISYGLYVFHGGVLILAANLTAAFPNLAPLACPVLALVVTTSLAAASYRWLETPFLHVKKRFEIVAH